MEQDPVLVQKYISYTAGKKLGNYSFNLENLKNDA